MLKVQSQVQFGLMSSFPFSSVPGNRFKTNRYFFFFFKQTKRKYKCILFDSRKAFRQKGRKKKLKQAARNMQGIEALSWLAVFLATSSAGLLQDRGEIHSAKVKGCVRADQPAQGPQLLNLGQRWKGTKPLAELRVKVSELTRYCP
ncbi:UNVERIFIED_CONTAM: hypothetical protein FKN15_023868 [Acipenser sinensis]